MGRFVIRGRLFCSSVKRPFIFISSKSVISRGILLVGVEVVEEKIVVLDAVLKMIDNLLLFVYFDSEAAFVVEDIFIIVHVIHFSR